MKDRKRLVMVDRYGIRLLRLDALTYSTTDGRKLSIRYSRGTRGRDDEDCTHYSFYVNKKHVLEKSATSFYLFECGDDDQVIVLPSEWFLPSTTGAPLDERGNWHVTIFRFKGQFKFWVEGSGIVCDATRYLNQFDKIREGLLQTASIPKSPTELMVARDECSISTGNDRLDGVIWSCGTVIAPSIVRLGLDGLPLPLVEDIARDCQSRGFSVQYVGGSDGDDCPDSGAALVLKGDDGVFSSLDSRLVVQLEQPRSREFLEGFLLPRLYVVLAMSAAGDSNQTCKDRMRIRVRADDYDVALARVLTSREIRCRIVHHGRIEVDPSHYAEEPFAEYLQAFSDDPDMELGGDERKAPVNPRRISGSIPRSVDHTCFPPLGIAHLAGKAKFNNKLKPYERKALFDISSRIYRGYRLSAKQEEFLDELLGAAVAAGLVEDACKRGPDCRACLTLREALVRYQSRRSS